MISNQKRPFYTTLALFTLGTFFSAQLAWALPSGVTSVVQAERPSLFQVEIPTELASVEEVFEAPAKKNPQLILHIQNIHGNYESQVQISKLLGYLYEKYGFKLIFAEGAAEKLNPNLLHFFPEKENNQQLADLMAKNGELTGIEYFLMEGPADVEAIGIEKAELYRENYEAFKKVYRAKEEVENFLEDFEGQLEVLGSQVFSANTRRLISEWKKFEKGHRDFLPFVKRLSADSKTILNLDLESLFSQVEWPQITRLLALQSMEKDLDRKAADRDRARLIIFLQNQNVPSEMIHAIETLHEEKITVSGTDTPHPHEDLPRYLFERLVLEAGPKGFQFHDYPAFSLWAGHLILKKELDSARLFEEIEKIFAQMLNELTITEREKNLLELYRDEILMRKLLHLEVTRKEWERVVYRKDWMKPEVLINRLEKIEGNSRRGDLGRGDAETGGQGENNFTSSPRLRVASSETYIDALDFYELARKREAVFYETMQKTMAEKNINKAVLVTGGFHTDGLMSLFRENDINASVLMPRITGDLENSNYISTMLETKPTVFQYETLEIIAAMQKAETRKAQGGTPDFYGRLAGHLMEIKKGNDPAAALQEVLEHFNVVPAFQIKRNPDGRVQMIPQAGKNKSRSESRKEDWERKEKLARISEQRTDLLVPLKRKFENEPTVKALTKAVELSALDSWSNERLTEAANLLIDYHRKIVKIYNDIKSPDLISADKDRYLIQIRKLLEDINNQLPANQKKAIWAKKESKEESVYAILLKNPKYFKGYKVSEGFKKELEVVRSMAQSIVGEAGADEIVAAIDLFMKPVKRLSEREAALEEFISILQIYEMPTAPIEKGFKAFLSGTGSSFPLFTSFYEIALISRSETRLKKLAENFQIVSIDSHGDRLYQYRGSDSNISAFDAGNAIAWELGLKNMRGMLLRIGQNNFFTDPNEPQSQGVLIPLGAKIVVSRVPARSELRDTPPTLDSKILTMTDPVLPGDPSQVRQTLSQLNSPLVSRRDFLATSAAAVLTGLAASKTSAQEIAKPLTLADQGRATFKGILSLIEPSTGLLVDKANIGTANKVQFVPGNIDYMKTSPTNIGLGLLSFLIGKDQGWMTPRDAEVGITKAITSLEKMERQEGFWYNWYDLRGVAAGGSPKVTLNRFVSSVDNANLTASLMVLREAYQGTALGTRIQKLLDGQRWIYFYDKKTNLMSHGFDSTTQKFSMYGYGTFNTEARLLAFIAVMQGVPLEAWNLMSREMIADKSGKIIVAASWGGSLFETLFADMFLGAPGALGKNSRDTIQIHINKAQELGSPIWGWSPSLDSAGIYQEFAVPEIGARGAGRGYPVGNISSYSVLLAAAYYPKEAAENLVKIRNLNPNSYHPDFGYRDSIDPKTGRVAPDILGLDKGMELVGLSAALQKEKNRTGTAESYFWKYLERTSKSDTGIKLLEAENAKFQEAKKIFLTSKPRTGQPMERLFNFLQKSSPGDWYTPGAGSIRRTQLNEKIGTENVFVTRIAYDVIPSGSFNGTAHTLLKGVDPREIAATHFIIRVRGDKQSGYTQAFKVEFKGDQGKILQTFSISGITEDWQEISIPLANNLGSIRQITTVFENSRADVKQGALLIADISLGRVAPRSETRSSIVGVTGERVMFDFGAPTIVEVTPEEISLGGGNISNRESVLVGKITPAQATQAKGELERVQIPKALQSNVEIVSKMLGNVQAILVPGETEKSDSTREILPQLIIGAPVFAGLMTREGPIAALGASLWVSAAASGILPFGSTQEEGIRFAGAFANESSSAKMDSLEEAIKKSGIETSQAAGGVLMVINVSDPKIVEQSLIDITTTLQINPNAVAVVIAVDPDLKRGQKLTPEEVEARLSSGGENLEVIRDRFKVVFANAQALDQEIQRNRDFIARKLGITGIVAMAEANYVESYVGDRKWIDDKTATSVAKAEDTLGMVVESLEALRAADLTQANFYVALTKALKISQKLDDILKKDFGFQLFNNAALSGFAAKLNEALTSLRVAISA